VHVVDRRGRGASGPQGPAYGIEAEVADLTAVQAATGADRIVAHSFGGLIALETARRTGAFSELVLYEPGVSVGGAIRVGWFREVEARLDRGDRRGAFAAFIRGSGGAPAVVTPMPVWSLKLALRLAVRPARWQRIEPLLATLIPEHRQVARLDDTYPSYAAITARTLLLGGSRSPRFLRGALTVLEATLPDARVELLKGLNHNAPDERPGRVALAALAFLHLP
jgi:pimeloyl-ACP methyl ester carboxylesterase